MESDLILAKAFIIAKSISTVRKRFKAWVRKVILHFLFYMASNRLNHWVCHLCLKVHPYRGDRDRPSHENTLGRTCPNRDQLSECCVSPLNMICHGHTQMAFKLMRQALQRPANRAACHRLPEPPDSPLSRLEGILATTKGHHLHAPDGTTNEPGSFSYQIKPKICDLNWTETSISSPLLKKVPVRPLMFLMRETYTMNKIRGSSWSDLSPTQGPKPGCTHFAACQHLSWTRFKNTTTLPSSFNDEQRIFCRTLNVALLQNDGFHFIGSCSRCWTDYEVTSDAGQVQLRAYKWIGLEGYSPLQAPWSCLTAERPLNPTVDNPLPEQLPFFFKSGKRQPVIPTLFEKLDPVQDGYTYIGYKEKVDELSYVCSASQTETVAAEEVAANAHQQQREEEDEEEEPDHRWELLYDADAENDILPPLYTDNTTGRELPLLMGRIGGDYVDDDNEYFPHFMGRIGGDYVDDDNEYDPLLMGLNGGDYVDDGSEHDGDSPDDSGYPTPGGEEEEESSDESGSSNQEDDADGDDDDEFQHFEKKIEYGGSIYAEERENVGGYDEEAEKDSDSVSDNHMYDDDDSDDETICDDD